MSESTKRPGGLKTRETVLEATRVLFLRQGYHATGMREIARDAGISLSAVYNHFSSKEEILEELLERRSLYAAMAEALGRARGDSVAELLQSGFTEIMSSLKGKEDFALLLFLDVLEFQGKHAAKLASQAIPRMLVFFERVYALGRQKGELREMPPLLLGRAYLQLIFSSFILENVVRVLDHAEVTMPLSMDGWEQGLIDILLHGVLRDPARLEAER